MFGYQDQIKNLTPARNVKIENGIKMIKKNRIQIKIVKAIQQTDYFIAAAGCRDVGFDELVQIIKIIRSNKHDSIHEKLRTLYKYHPDTISLDRSRQECDCGNYNESVCDCYLPGVDFEDCYCRRKRKEYLRNTDYRNTSEYTNWRKSVFERDTYTCQDCGQIGKRLNAHHLKTFKKHQALRYDIHNGVTLCVECHRERHRGGK